MKKANILIRGLSAAISLLLMVPGASTFPKTSVISAEEEKIYYYDDLDGDEKLTVFDLCLMKRVYINPERLTDLLFPHLAAAMHRNSS